MARTGARSSATCRSCRCTTSMIKDNDLVVATHGRSFWILDDISPLRQMTPRAVEEGARALCAGRCVPHPVGEPGRGLLQPASQPVGMNPSSGVIIYYSLAAANQTVTIDILDAKGKLVRSFSSVMDSLSAADSVRGEALKAARADSLRKAGRRRTRPRSRRGSRAGVENGLESAVPAARARRTAGAGQGGAQSLRLEHELSERTRVQRHAVRRQRAARWRSPGRTGCAITAGGVKDSARFRLVNDPRGTANTEDLKAQFDFRMKVRDTLSRRRHGAAHGAQRAAAARRPDGEAEAVRHRRGEAWPPPVPRAPHGGGDDAVRGADRAPTRTISSTRRGSSSGSAS